MLTLGGSEDSHGCVWQELSASAVDRKARPGFQSPLACQLQLRSTEREQRILKKTGRGGSGLCCLLVQWLRGNCFNSLTLGLLFSSIHSPGKRILSFSLGGPVPAPRLRRRQQPPRQDQLGPGEPDPPRLTAQPPGGAGAAAGARGRRRGVHLPRSARPGLPARLPEALAAE